MGLLLEPDPWPPSTDRPAPQIVEGRETTEKKEWTYYELSDYRYLSYAEFGTLVDKLGSALAASGHAKDTVFNIYAQTSMHWFAMANGCARQSVTFATAYDSLGEDGVRSPSAEILSPESTS